VHPKLFTDSCAKRLLLQLGTNADNFYVCFIIIIIIIIIIITEIVL